MVNGLSPRSAAGVFDRVAQEYQRNRPGYPDELIDRACELAGLRSGDRVLELGCASGQLTRSLVARGLDVVALEPGAQLIALAEQSLQGHASAEFVNARFEDATLAPGQFRAVFSAAAFQWIDPDVSWAKAASALVPGGTLALIQYCALAEPYGARDQQELLSALATVAPELAANWPASRELDAIAAGVAARSSNVSQAWAWIGRHEVARGYAAGLFCDVDSATVATLLEYTADELNALLATASFYHRLTQAQRDALEREHAAIYERLGRPIRSSMVAVLVTARRASAV